MRSISRCIFSVLAAAVLCAATLSSAQTLHRRPPASHKAPVAKAAPARRTAKANPSRVVLPKGTSLQVAVTHPYPMKAGESIQGRLLHPIYVNGRLAVPEHTLLRGKVVALKPDRKTRWRARLRGDFTPFDKAKVRFNELMLPSDPLSISAATADNGAPLLHLTAGTIRRHSFIARQWLQARHQMHQDVAWFIRPGLGGRALQMLYHQLPYHPQRIAAHTAWSFELTAPLTLPDLPVAKSVPAPPAPAHGKQQTWTVDALLTHELTSARARPGDVVKALVVEPVYNKKQQLVVPQGSTLIGKVTEAKAARSFGRNGKLRFSFQQIRFPQGYGKPVEGSLAGASTQKTQDLQLDAEGTVTPRNKTSAIAPILLTMLAGKGLDQDGGVAANAAHSGVASNGLGLVGRIVGVAAGSPNLAAGIGFYAAGLSFYDNFLRTGRDVVFPKDTRIEIQTTPLHVPVLKAQRVIASGGRVRRIATQ